MRRREAIEAATAAAIGAATGCSSGNGTSPESATSTAAATANPPTMAPMATGLRRKLGRTGLEVEPVSLGGEGVLRTTGRADEAVPMILEALKLGVRYCDTAPAYAASQDYYGAAFSRAGAGSRDKVILASKTHLRDRDGSLRLLDDSLTRLGTDRLDIWQLHDLRTTEDLDEIFSKGGAIEAVEKAKADGRVKFVGITGHHDPAILVEAMRRYPVDTVLCAINPSDPRRAPFLTTVVPAARDKGVGIIGMKVMGRGDIISDGVASGAELIRYAASFADTVIIGCSSPREVKDNLEAGRAFSPLDEAGARALEARIAPHAKRYDTYKA
jgi:aryl-alcohol dehydrogenase-like predicted oxidoreductase